MRKKSEELPREKEKFEPYTLVAYVTGPVYKIDVSASSFHEAYAKAMGMLQKEMEKYGGKVKLQKIELNSFADELWW